MQFKLITNDDGIKEIHHRNEAGVPFSVIPVGTVETPTDPQALFVWMTNKLKETGTVPALTQFTLNLP
jgi:hypothetical protein